MQKQPRFSNSALQIAVLFLHDVDGTFGQRLAEYAVLDELMNDAEYDRYKNFMNDRKTI